MSDIIHLLPDNIANQIAAGEVIQRPASVVKELVENSVDAGASRIEVNIKDAGKTLIQVIDNGKGMSETDARMAFERHATSKISKAEDLFSLKTMGFRGEALASIAAVACVDLRTRLKGEEIGNRVSIEGSAVKSVEADSCSEGSIFSVKNLFFNVPARRKFLKSNETEFRNILAEFERIALVNPSISFALYHNGTEVFNLPSSNIRQRILDIYGKNINSKLLSVEAESSLVSISGFVGCPDSAKKRGFLQYFFVNGRYMRHPYFHKAVQEAYEQLIPANEQISYFLYFNVDPANIDVNIHPTKTEIKFENEQAIWQIIVAAVKESLGRFNAVPTIDFDTEGAPEIPVFESEAGFSEAPTVQTDSGFNPFKTSSGKSSYKREPIEQEWEKLYEKNSSDVIPSSSNDLIGFDEADELEDTTLLGSAANDMMEKSTLHYQYKGKYILTSVKSGLMIIDQHRAHVRVLYDRYRKQMSEHNGASQGLLFPEMLQLPVSEGVLLEQLIPDLEALGFDLSVLGGGTFSVNAIPSGTEGLNPVDMVTDIVHSAQEKGGKVEEELQYYIALSLARNSAIVQGQVLSNEEMENLVDNLFVCKNPNYTPDGKIIVAILEQEDFEQLFR